MPSPLTKFVHSALDAATKTLLVARDRHDALTFSQPPVPRIHIAPELVPSRWIAVAPATSHVITPDGDPTSE